MEPIIISASFFQEQLSLGVLGRTGEHEARRISFDCGQVLKAWPEATILCVCRRPCDTAAYPIPLTSDGTTYTMPLTSLETAASGTIKLELRAVRDDTVLKSAIFYGRILPSLNGQKDAPGNPLSDALNRLESTIANAQTLADEIRQKLDNGEFVGERGPQGAPGKDGSDATVTAANIETALGYVPVTPSDLAAKQDALTDADRQSITKTGMTTGAAWTSAEQKAARERMGVSGEFEFIEEITLSENVINVAREAFPDGTPYNLRSLIIVVDSTNVENRPTIVQGWVRLNTKLPSNEWAYIAPGKFVSTDIVFSYFVYRVSSDGSVDSYSINTIGGPQTANASTRSYIPSNIIRFGMHINDFLLYSTNEPLPANTKISIYGVRA